MRYLRNVFIPWAIALTLVLSMVTVALAQSTSTEGIDSLLNGTKEKVEGVSSLIIQSNSVDTATFGSSLSAFANKPSELDIPDPEDAFTLSSSARNPEELIVRFDILSCCYLYQERMSVKALDENVVLGTPSFTEGKIYEDAFFGKTIVHRNNVEISVPIVDKPAESGSISLMVGYQGCSDAGVCYPPQEKNLVVGLGDASDGAATVLGTVSIDSSFEPKGLTTGSGYVSEQDRLSSRLATSGLLALPLFFGLGILLAFTPCVFPMVPILSGIITADKNINQTRAFVLSSVYVLSMAITYAIFGVLAAATGANLQVAFQHPAVLIGFSALFVVLALSMFGLFTVQVPVVLQNKLTSMSNRQSGGRVAAVSMMGVLSALIVGPCVAAPLIGVLGYITMSGDIVLGGITLFVLGLGMGLPLLVIGTSAGRLLPKAGPWMNTIKSVFGVGLLAVAIWMLERVFPPTITMLLWAALALSVAVFLNVGREVENRAIPLLGKAFGHALTAYGVMILIGVASGATDPLRPLYPLTQKAGGGSAVVSHPVFQPVTSVKGLDSIIAASANTGKPVLLDFYADWCVSCKEMEKYTFSDPLVAELMSQFTLVQADVTKNTTDDKTLLERYGLFGPPAILFFQLDGSESSEYRVMGFMKANNFASVLKQVYRKAVSTPSLTLSKGS